MPYAQSLHCLICNSVRVRMIIKLTDQVNEFTAVRRELKSKVWQSFEMSIGGYL